MRETSTSGFLTFAAGSVPQTSGNVSLAAIVRSGSVTSAKVFFSIDDGVNGWNVGHSSASKWQYGDFATTRVVTSTIVLGTFYLVGMSKVSGTTLPRFHWLALTGGSWVHENVTGTVADSSAPTSPSVYLGCRKGLDNFWNSGIALVAAWDRVLSDAEFELLPFALSYWYASQPKAGWLLDQSAITQNVPDFTGRGATQSARTGTTVSPNSVPGFSYGMWPTYVERQPAAAGGGGANSPRDLLLLGAG